MRRDMHIQWRALWEATRRDSEWVGQAACRLMPKAIFFPVEKVNTEPAKRAKKICADCPVKADCLRDHIDEEFGIFGGLDPIERRRHKLGITTHPRCGDACGTNTGYERHKRYLDTVCPPCRDARNAYLRSLYEKARA